LPTQCKYVFSVILRTNKKYYPVGYYQTEYSNGDLSLCWTELIYYKSGRCLGLNSTVTDIVQYNINVTGLITYALQAGMRVPIVGIITRSTLVAFQPLKF
jgi:hypothetical protein